ncbi:hypothetical protein Patl1_28754 [Pistacia atlantica]|uniref:Uncharacterized protein n=1 Tax=Pistacia atlantica TaxID=434234 RepID=A0ACC1BCN9_9ROSI|nr:hypothetical protein Patl1_28754 [Pistacia atlantica]
MKEELKRAKDSATQSWLDSRPLIDELERLKSGLATAKNRYSLSNTVVSELQSELETSVKSIRAKKEEELNATRMINELSQTLDETREELETLKLAADEELRARSKLKQVSRLRRQTLRTSQLTLRAARIESEAFRASAAEALRYIKISEIDGTTVHLTHEEYHALTRKAEEETSLADWRISVSIEQKHAAEVSRNFALSRLKESYSVNRSKRRRMEGKQFEEGSRGREAEEQDLNIKVEAQENRGFAIPKARARLIAESSRRNPQPMRRAKSNINKKLIKKRKTSIFHQIKSFLVRSIARLFG